MSHRWQLGKHFRQDLAQMTSHANTRILPRFFGFLSCSTFLLGSLAAPLHSELPLEGQFPKAPNALFSFDEWQCCSQLATDDDIVFMKDGSLCRGRLEALPPIAYSFGSLSFLPEEIALVSFIEHSQQLKVQYITKEGEDFVGSFGAEGVAFMEKREGSAPLLRRLDPRQIQTVLVRKRQTDDAVGNTRLFSLEFKNGDRLPITPASESILLTNGRQDYALRVQDLIDISYNGGVQGIVKDDTLGIKRLDYSLVKDKYFTVQLTRKGDTLKLPWDKIAAIQGCNSGFRQDVATLENKVIAEFKSRPPTPQFDYSTIIAFAADAFQAFMQPIFSVKKSQPMPSGVSGGAQDGEPAIDFAQPQSIADAELIDLPLFIAADFYSPFHISYELEFFNASLMIADAEGGNSSFFPSEGTSPFPDEANTEEVAMLSPSDQMKINEILLFENQQSLKVDPEIFDFVDSPFGDEPKTKSPFFTWFHADLPWWLEGG